jgi:A/G-specific adenine glycosylase
MEDPTPIDDPSFKKCVHNSLAEIYPEQAGDFTQALMELGATVCVPNGKPDCDRCPCAAFCCSLEHGTQQSFPMKLPKKKRRVEDRTVFIMNYGEEYALLKRPSKGLLAGLWESPNMTGRLGAADALKALEERGVKVRNVIREAERNHIFTHIEWKMVGIYVEVSEKHEGVVWMSAKDIQNTAAIPTAFRQFLEDVFVN